jgi:hypothetical protein
MLRRCYPQINLPAALKWHLQAPSSCLTHSTANPRRPWRPSHAATNYSSFFTALNAVLIARGASGSSRHRRLLTLKRAATALNQPLLVVSLGFSVLERDSLHRLFVCVVWCGSGGRCGACSTCVRAISVRPLFKVERLFFLFFLFLVSCLHMFVNGA